VTLRQGRQGRQRDSHGHSHACQRPRWGITAFSLPTFDSLTHVSARATRDDGWRMADGGWRMAGSAVTPFRTQVPHLTSHTCFSPTTAVLPSSPPHWPSSESNPPSSNPSRRLLQWPSHFSFVRGIPFDLLTGAHLSVIPTGGRGPGAGLQAHQSFGGGSFRSCMFASNVPEFATSVSPCVLFFS